nr:hypothetical protein [Mycoplasmopsis bovis]
MYLWTYESSEFYTSIQKEYYEEKIYATGIWRNITCYSSSCKLSCVNETNIKAQEDKKEKEASKKEIMKEENKTKNKSLSSSTTESTKIAEASKTEAPKPKLAVRDSSNDSIFETWYTGSITKEKATLKKSKTEETPEAKIFDRLYKHNKFKYRKNF